MPSSFSLRSLLDLHLLPLSTKEKIDLRPTAFASNSSAKVNSHYFAFPSSSSISAVCPLGLCRSVDVCFPLLSASVSFGRSSPLLPCRLVRTIGFLSFEICSCETTAEKKDCSSLSLPHPPPLQSVGTESKFEKTKVEKRKTFRFYILSCRGVDAVDRCSSSLFGFDR